jgi:hypothetical protein
MNKLSIFYEKIKIGATVVASIVMAFLMPIVPLLLIVGGLIFLDTCVGLWRAYKTNELISSKKLSNIISKMVLYQTSIITFFLIEKYIVGDFIVHVTSIQLFLTKVLACTLCSIELKSMDESYQIVTGISIWDRFKLLLKRSNEVKKGVKEIINDDTNE